MSDDKLKQALVKLEEKELVMASLMVNQLVDDAADPKPSLDKLRQRISGFRSHPLIEHALASHLQADREATDGRNAQQKSLAIRALSSARAEVRATHVRAKDILDEMPNAKVLLTPQGPSHVKDALKRAVAEIRRLTSQDTSHTRPATPDADKGIGPIKFQVRVGKWATLKTDKLEDIQDMLLKEERFGSRLFRLFSLLTIFEAGREDPLPWWPGFLRGAARDFAIE